MIAKWIVCVWVLCVPITAFADVIHLKTGSAIDTPKSWESGGVVKFLLNDLVMEIEKADIDHIQKDDRSLVFDQKRPKKTPLTQKNTTVKQRPAAPAAKTKTKQSKPAPKQLAAATIAAKNSATKQDSDDRAVKHKRPPAEKLSVVEIIAKVPKFRTRVGFRGLYWEDAAFEIKGLKRVGSEPIYGGIDQYVCNQDLMQFGQAQLSKIIYSFWHGHFLSVTIWTDGFDAYKALRREVFAKYGRGLHAANNTERYIWAGGPSDKLLEFDHQLDKGLLWYRNNALWQRLKAEYPDETVVRHEP